MSELTLTITKHCLDRIEACGITGPKRQADAALHYLTGAAVALFHAGHESERKHIANLAFLCSIGGVEVLRRTSQGDPE